MLGRKLETGSIRASTKNSAAQGKNKLAVIYDTLIIGAGFSGAFTAEQACEANSQAKIALVDRDGLLSPTSSSQNECFKMHTGLHYISDRETAETCLRHSVEMADAFHEFILDRNDSEAPSRRGRHYIMSNSYTNEYVEAECENLKSLYTKLIEEFPNAKKAFGDPEDFIKYLEPKDYSYVSPNILFSNKEKLGEEQKGSEEKIHVRLGIETPECQIDIHQFKDYFSKVFVHRRKQLSLF